jgi:hypothetical protein
MLGVGGHEEDCLGSRKEEFLGAAKSATKMYELWMDRGASPRSDSVSSKREDGYEGG